MTEPREAKPHRAKAKPETAPSTAERAIDKLHRDRLEQAQANGEGPWVLVVEVEGGVTIRLHAESKVAYDLACAAAERHGIPFI